MKTFASGTMPLDSILSIRAAPLAVGVHTVVVSSSLEAAPFELYISVAMSDRLANYLGVDLEIGATVSRSSDGTISGGILTEFTAVEDGDGLKEWRDWFRSVGGDDWLKESLREGREVG